jgi:hypothetical protein
MKKLICLFIILLSTIGWNQSFAQETFQQEFENKEKHPVLIMRGTEVLSTLGPQMIENVTVREGDRITIDLPENLDFSETALYGVEPMYMSKARNNIIEIRFLKKFSEFEQRRGHKALPMATNFKGVDLAKYDQLAVAKSFSKQSIFENLGTHNFGYKFQDGEVLPIGFDYTGQDNDEFGSDQISSYSSSRKFEEGFSVSVTGEAPIPGTPVTVGLGVGYSESKKEGSAEDDIYFSNFSGIEVYTVNLYEEDLVDVLLTKKFKDAVNSLNNQSDVEKKIIERFGTHYPESVTYGGSFRSWKQVSSKDYYEMEKQGIDVSATVKIATPTEKKTITDKHVNKQGNGYEEAVESTSGGAQGNAGFNFSHVQESEYKNKLSKSNGNFRAVGGSGDKATAVKTQLVKIHNLVYPHIFKDGSDEKDLNDRRKWIEDAVLEYLKKSELTKISAPVPAYKLYKARLSRAKKVDKNLDDANQKMMGSIVLKEPGTSNEYPLWKEDNFIMINEASGELKLDVDQPWTIIKVPIINGVVQNIVLNAEVNLVNLDDCCGNDPHIKSLSINLKENGGIKDYKIKASHTAFLEETHWEVKFVIMEIPDLDNTPPLNSRTRSISSTPSAKIKIPTRSSSITEEEFNAASKAVVVKSQVEKPKKVIVTTPSTTTTANTNIIETKDELFDLNGTYYIADAKHNGALRSSGSGGVYHHSLPRNSPGSVFNWYFIPTGDGYYYIYDLQFNKALIGPDYIGSSGSASVYHQDPNGKATAQWKITPSGKAGQYIITDRKHSKSIVAGDVANNFIYLQSHNNRQNAYWTFTVTKDKAPAIKPNPNAIPATTKPPTTTTTTTSTTTTKTAAPINRDLPWLKNDYVRIQHKMNNTHYIHNQYEQLENGPIQADWLSAQWKFIPYGGSTTTGNFQLRSNPDLYLSDNGGKLEVVKNPDLQWSNVIWRIIPLKDGSWVKISSSASTNKNIIINDGKFEIEYGSIQPANSLWKLEFSPISGSGIVAPRAVIANVALNKKTKQSSTNDGYSSHFAVDGKTEYLGYYNPLYGFIHTLADKDPWWEVDLGANYNISQINIFNVTDHRKSRTKNLYIRVSKTPFTGNDDGQVFASNVFPDTEGSYKGDATGRYVRVYRINRRVTYLNLCEVQVMGTPE